MGENRQPDVCLARTDSSLVNSVLVLTYWKYQQVIDVNNWKYQLVVDVNNWKYQLVVDVNNWKYQLVVDVNKCIEKYRKLHKTNSE